MWHGGDLLGRSLGETTGEVGKWASPACNGRGPSTSEFSGLFCDGGGEDSSGSYSALACVRHCARHMTHISSFHRYPHP